MTTWRAIGSPTTPMIPTTWFKGQPYTGIHLPYEETERLWAVFNRLYLVVYDASAAPAILPILNEDVDEATLWTACAGARPGQDAGASR